MTLRLPPFFIGILASILVINSGFSWAEKENQNSDTLTLQMAIESVIAENPSLAKIKERYNALSNIPSQMGTLPDPMLTLGAMSFPTDTYDRNQEPMTQLQLGFSQAFPFPGKLNLREEIAEFQAKAEKYSVEEMQLTLTSRTKQKWLQIFYLDMALNTVNSNHLLLQQFIDVAKTKYETGKGLQQDVLLAQLELSKLIDQKINIEAMRRNQTIQLNVLMGRAPQIPIKLPTQVPENGGSLISEAFLHDIAKKSRPILNKRKHLVSAAKSRMALAELGYFPDFKLSFAYSDRTGENSMPMGGERSDLLSVKLGVTVPLYTGSKQSRMVKQQKSEYQKQRYGLIDDENNVLRDISTAISDYDRASEKMTLFKSGIIPQARQTVQSMLAGYQVSEVDFLNLVRSQVTLFNYELQYWKALTENNQALAKLQAAVGKESVYE